MKRLRQWLQRLLVLVGRRPQPLRHYPSPLRVEAGKRAAITRQRRKHFEKALEEVERFLSIDRYRVDKKETGSFSGLHHTKPSDMNYAEPFIIAESLPEYYPDTAMVYGNADPEELKRPLDMRVLTEITDKTDYQKGWHANLLRTRRVSGREVRGRVRMYMPYMVEERIVFLNEETNRGDPGVRYWGTSDMKRWLMIGVGWETHWADLADARRINLMHGLALTRQSRWLIGIQQEGSRAMTLPTDPVGVREMFRLRDIPEGRKRRASLLNWVSDHYRQKYDDPSAEVYVRKHLRGATRFHWNGLICSIKPPIADAEFSLRPDLVAQREEVQNGAAALLDIDDLAIPSHEEMVIRDREVKELMQGYVDGTVKMEPGNKKGTWVTLTPKDSALMQE